MFKTITRAYREIFKFSPVYSVFTILIDGVDVLIAILNAFLTPANIKEMRVLGFDGYLADKWSKINDEVNEENWRFQMKDSVSMFLFDLFKIICYMIGIASSVYLVYSERISIGQFGACIAAFASLQSRIYGIIVQFSFFVINIPYAKDYFSFLDIPTDRMGQQTFNGLKEFIEVKDVSFKYPNSDKYVLADINLTMKRGEKIALVGENGSGKTTLSKILLGIYPPDVGEVMFDGVDVSKYEKSTLCDDISAVTQDFTKFSMTLRENVAIGNTMEMSNDEMIAATLERTDISEAMEGKTALIISHRVGLCRMADRIVVLQDGRIIENGKHDELMEKKGHYYKLFTSQQQWYV